MSEQNLLKRQIGILKLRRFKEQTKTQPWFIFKGINNIVSTRYWKDTTANTSWILNLIYPHAKLWVVFSNNWNFAQTSSHENKRFMICTRLIFGLAEQPHGVLGTARKRQLHKLDFCKQICRKAHLHKWLCNRVLAYPLTK